jgi:NADH-quinone oxidoreductase subunit D
LFQQREKILNLIESASGGRMTPSYFRIGGLMMDLPAGLNDAASNSARFSPRRWPRSRRWLPATPSGRAGPRTSDHIGEDAIDWGLTGPCLRGSGVDLDLRRDNPYTGYETYDFNVA